MKAETASLRWNALWSPLLCGIAAFSLYVFCLAPSVATGGDCGELISAAYRIGVAHPSGYALYCLLTKIFATIFPFGEVAWRFNLFSALCGAGAVGIIAYLLPRFFLSRASIEPNAVSAGSTPKANIFAASTAALLLAGFIFFGAQSLIAEVYAPTGLAVALLFWCAAAWNETRNFAALCALALGLGLALNLHLSTIFLWPALLIFFAWHYKRTRTTERAQSTPGQRLVSKRIISQSVLATLCFLLGLSTSLYLPLRAATFPEPPREMIAGQEYSWYQPLDWGHPVDFPRWKAHVLVQQYKSLLWQTSTVKIGGREINIKTFTQSPAQALTRLRELLSFFALQFLWAAPLVLWGAVASWREEKKRPLAALLLSTLALNVLIAVEYRVDNVFDITNFLFPTYIVLAIWMGLGIAALLAFTARCGDWSWRLSTLCKLAIVGAIVTQWILFAGAASWRGNTRARDDALERATALEKLQRQTERTPTLLAFSDDVLFPFWYAQKVLGQAPDVRTPFGPALHAHEEAGTLPQLATRLMKNGPVVTTQWRESWSKNFSLKKLTASGNLWLLQARGVSSVARPLNKNLKENWAANFGRDEIRRGELVGLNFDFLYEISPEILNKITPDDKAVGIATAALTIALSGTSNAPPAKSPNTFHLIQEIQIPTADKENRFWHMELPCEIPIETLPGQYDIWLQFQRSEQNSTARWNRVGSVRVVVR